MLSTELLLSNTWHFSSFSSLHAGGAIVILAYWGENEERCLTIVENNRERSGGLTPASRTGPPFLAPLPASSPQKQIQPPKLGFLPEEIREGIEPYISRNPSARKDGGAAGRTGPFPRPSLAWCLFFSQHSSDPCPCLLGDFSAANVWLLFPFPPAQGLLVKHWPHSRILSYSGHLTKTMWTWLTYQIARELGKTGTPGLHP